MSDDAKLKQVVLEELKWEPSVNAAHIGVTVRDGVITLMGHVESYAEKRCAERAAQRVKDVKAVVEQLEVKLPSGVKRGDEEITAAALSRLKWDTALRGDDVKLKVEKGWITLTGAVDWRYQQDAAVDDVRALHGVIGVSNEMSIKPKVNTANIRNDIMLALDRSWFDPETIEVTAQGGQVTLTGKVGSWYERNAAISAAWAAAGTTSVENHLAIV
jgi:osmotically-inducible protein OsmY